MKLPARLDCETFSSALKSISDAYSQPVDDVIKFLSDIDLEKEFETWEIHQTADKHLLQLFQSQFGKQIRQWDSVCWFHLTRVPRDTSFAEGILPLHLALDKIWTTVYEILSDPRKSKLLKLRNGDVPDHLYNMKTSSVLHSGPYAMLVRESAFHSSSMGNHDYLAFPEIVEDICNPYQHKYGERIHEEVSSRLHGCIVKFEIETAGVDGLLEPALYYCWREIQKEEMSLDANTCYDGQGKTVPASAIRRVEFIDGP